MYHLGKFNLGCPVDFIICVIFSEVEKHKQVETNDIMSQHFGRPHDAIILLRNEEMRENSEELIKTCRLT